MGSFQDEIAAIEREREIPVQTTFPPVLNTAEDIECFKRDGPDVIDTICEGIKEKIRKNAKENRIAHQLVKKGFLFPRFEEVNPYYAASWELYVKFDKNIGFRYGWMKVPVNEEQDPFSRQYDRMGLSIKNPEFVIGIMKAVAQQLEQDNIVAIELIIIRDDIRDPYAQKIVQRVTIPTEG
ncbi:MAG: hypothetical protein K2O18_08225 [Oscillospiraceae bacterium]|nr:hypothetical protein [Oscillospiraceae bacterium]